MEALSNPVRLISKPGNSKPRERRLNKDEEKRLFAACRESKSKGLEAIVALGLETGCRLGELLSMQWTDVDLRARIVTLQETKNGERRTVPLSTSAIQLLRKLRTEETGRVLPYWKNAWSFEHAWGRGAAREARRSAFS
jgi:integrase